MLDQYNIFPEHMLLSILGPYSCHFENLKKVIKERRQSDKGGKFVFTPDRTTFLSFSFDPSV